jgi:hypothetical protein
MSNVATAPQIQRREKWVDLPEEYEGFKIKIWVNAPTRLWAAIGRAGDNEEAAQDAAQKIVMEHNGWLDYDGEPFPAANTKEFWEAIPTELAGVIFALVQYEMGNLPNSIATRKRSSRRG